MAIDPDCNPGAAPGVAPPGWRGLLPMGGGHHQEVAEGGDIAGAGGLSGAAQKRGSLADPVLDERPVGRGGVRVKRSRTQGRDKS
ncbi:hypothetical protein ACFY04_13915 [Streptomyces sp. NPDC001549]|uniref:hypothetical protein n=1 Tax=Streptomyces sp. NPDC001549 TaxID=3364586 RepID=UPI0036B290D8